MVYNNTCYLSGAGTGLCRKALRRMFGSKWIRSAVAVVFIFVGQGATLALRAAHDEASQDEYVIYDTVIQRLYVERKNPSLIVIARQTESGAQAEPGKGPIIGVADAEQMKQALKSISELVAAYQAVNQSSVKLKSKFELPVDYVLVDKAKALALIAKDRGSITDFGKKYPGSEPVGLIGLSRVGFNQTSTEALIYAAHWCGNHCGDAMFLLLVKVNGSWKIKYQTIASASQS